MDEYIHEPIDLGGPAIRLLRLLQGTDLEVECELFQAWLPCDDTVSYEALSYTWGGTDLSATVTIDGKPYGVTENLYLALQYLRSPETDRVLWVDAICIDQRNDKERGHQVQQMGSIYSYAERVLIWLGPPTDDTDVLMDSLKQLERESLKHACKRWSLLDDRWQKLWVSQQLMLMSQHWDLAARQRAGFEDLLKRPWFKRVWILQEVANATRALVCSGTRSVSARFFALTPSLLNAEPSLQCQAVFDIMPGPSRQDSWWSKKRDLHTLLLKFHGSKAGDPRDMVYALLGISTDARDTEALRADYTKSVKQVVEDTALFLFGLSNISHETISDFFENFIAVNQESFKRIVRACCVSNVQKYLLWLGDDEKVTEGVIEAAVANLQSGKEVTELLLQHAVGELKVTTEILNSAAGNKECGEEIIELLHGKWGEDVTMAAARSGKAVMEILLRRRGDKIEITERVLKVAAESSKEVMQLLFIERGQDIILTEEIVKAAAGSRKDIMVVLFAERGSEVKVTEEVLKAAAGNSKEMMEYLFEVRGSELEITAGVVQAAAENTKDVMQLLFRERGKQIEITEEVVKAAAANWSGSDVLKLLIRLRGSEVKITEEVVKAAAGNNDETFLLLLQQRGSEVRITEEVVKAAVRNTRSGRRVVEAILLKEGCRVRVTEGVVAAAAENPRKGLQALNRLLDQRGWRVEVTEEAERCLKALPETDMFDDLYWEGQFRGRFDDSD